MSAPAVGILFFCLLVGFSPFGKDAVFLAGVSLMGREKGYAAVFVMAVVPVFKL